MLMTTTGCRTVMLLLMEVDQISDRRQMSIRFRRCSKQFVRIMDIVGEGGDLASFKQPTQVTCSVGRLPHWLHAKLAVAKHLGEVTA